MRRIFSMILATALMCSMMVTGASAAYTHETSRVGGTWSFSNDPIRKETVSIEVFHPRTSFNSEGEMVEDNYYELTDYTAYVLPAGTEITAINAGDGGWGPNTSIFVGRFDLDGHRRNREEEKGLSDQIVIEDATLYEIYGLYERGESGVGPGGYVDPFYVKGVASANSGQAATTMKAAAGTKQTYKVAAGIDAMSEEPLEAYELTLSNVLSEPTKKIIKYRDWDADVFDGGVFEPAYKDSEITVITLDPSCTITASNGSLYFATTILEDDSHVASGGYVVMDSGVTIDELVKYTSDNQDDGRIYLFTPMGANIEGCVLPFYFTIGTGADNATKPASGFTDVISGAYYADAVKWAVEKKVTAGTTPTTFAPGATCTDAQILTFLWRANGEPKSTIANPFGNVKESDYFYQAALWAHEKGLVSGSTFRSTTPCTRSQTVMYLWKLAGQPTANKSVSFTDVDSNADYAKAVAWAVEQGITSGTSATTFAPDTTCTRGQIVTFLYRDLA